MDGKTVPLVYNHGHKDLNNVIGKVLLQNRDDGVYGFGILNKDVDGGKTALSLIKHGDLNSLSIFANDLVEQGPNVVHGVIREVSLVLAGANSGATIDTIAHGIDAEDEDGLSGIQIFAGEENPIIHSDAEEEYESYLSHAADGGENKQNDSDEIDIEAVIATMNDEQKTAMKIMMGLVAEEAEKASKNSSEAKHSLFESFEGNEDSLSHSEENEESNNEYNEDEEGEKEENYDPDLYDDNESDDDGEESDLEHDGMGYDPESEENIIHSEEGENEMRQNNIDGFQSLDGQYISKGELCHSMIMDAMKYGTLKESVMAHSAQYGIENIDMLFPEARTEGEKPEYIKRRTEWVAEVLDNVRRAPFARIKSIFADITEDDARAKGYIKGNKKTEEVFTLLKRETNPTTVFKKQKVDRDDVTDIRDFNIIVFLKDEMRILFDEEVARAILIGDGRAPLSPDKIKEDCIRPIWKDDDLFTIKKAIPCTSATSDQTRARQLIRSIVKSFKQYRGSGKPTLFISPDLLADMLLIEDTNQRIIYDTVDKLKNTLRVKDIVEVPLFDGQNRLDGADTKYLAAIMVNLTDYRVGRDKGGEINFFEDFDIDFNQQKYLMEARMSGALTVPYSAVAFEFVYNLTIDIQAEEPTTVVLGKSVGDFQSEIFVNDNFVQGTLNYTTGYTGYSDDPAEQNGYFLALKYEASEGAEIFVKTIGGYHDELGEQQLDSDMQTLTRVKSNRMKLVVRTVLGDESITKTLSFAGLKLVQ